MLDELVRRHDVVICAGSGGVGKTTTAASVALHAALGGRRTIVMTIDPAKRLADALGMHAAGLPNTPMAVEGVAGGRLSAMVLDQKSAWDELVRRHAPSPETCERILHNRFYQNLSQSFAGSQEYMAVEQLAALHASGRYDLIVVDTPPTRHALDFLDAPQRIADLLDRSIVKWFVRPYFSASWRTLRAVNRTVGFLFRRLEEATGISALSEVSEFFTSMGGLFEGFEPRVRRVYQLLRARQTAFVLVVTPEEQVLSEAEYFCSKVRELEMPLRGVVFNRVHKELGAGRDLIRLEAVEQLLRRTLSEPAAAERLALNFDRYEMLGRGDGLRVDAFRQLLPKNIAAVEVPNFNADLHSVDDLERMHPFLFAG